MHTIIIFRQGINKQILNHRTLVDLHHGAAEQRSALVDLHELCGAWQEGQAQAGRRQHALARRRRLLRGRERVGEVAVAAQRDHDPVDHVLVILPAH